MVDCIGAVLVGSSICCARRTSRGRSGTSPTGVRGCDAAEEAELGGVHVADAGEVASGRAARRDRRGRGRRASRRSASSASQSGPSRSGPRWPTSVLLVGAASSSTMPSEKPTATARVGLEHDPGLRGPGRRHRCPGGRPARRPPSSGGCAGSRLVASMRVSRCLPRETRLGDRAAGEVGGGELRGPGSRCAVSTWPASAGRAAGRRGRRCRPQARQPQPQPSRRGDEAGGVERLAQRGRSRRRAAARRRPSRR